jgi:hypothetical protein
MVSSDVSLEEYQMALIAAADEISALKSALEASTHQALTE